jgi:chromosome segregation ATPase
MALTVEDIDRRATELERAQGETTETLRWVVIKLARVQAVQDEHTLRLERLESKVDQLDGRLGKVETRLENVETQLESLPRAIAEMIAASEKRIMAAVRLP